MSAANNFVLVIKPSGRSLIEIKKIKSPKIEPCGTPAVISIQLELWPLNTTLCFLLLRKSIKIFNNLPEIPFFCKL